MTVATKPAYRPKESRLSTNHQFSLYCSMILVFLKSTQSWFVAWRTDPVTSIHDARRVFQHHLEIDPRETNPDIEGYVTVFVGSTTTQDYDGIGVVQKDYVASFNFEELDENHNPWHNTPIFGWDLFRVPPELFGEEKENGA